MCGGGDTAANSTARHPEVRQRQPERQHRRVRHRLGGRAQPVVLVCGQPHQPGAPALQQPQEAAYVGTVVVDHHRHHAARHPQRRREHRVDSHRLHRGGVLPQGLGVAGLHRQGVDQQRAGPQEGRQGPRRVEGHRFRYREHDRRGLGQSVHELRVPLR